MDLRKNKKTEAPESEAIVETTTSALVAKMAMPSAFEGEFTAADIKLPYLTICQKSGNLMDSHPEWLGKWVYDKAASLGDTISVVFFKVKKFYLENLPFGSDTIPRRFDTAAEAAEANCNVVDVAELDCLIEVADDFDGGKKIGDKSYIIARYTVRSTAYGATVRVLVKDSAMRLNNNLPSGQYKLKTEKKTNGSNSWYAPVLMADGKSPEDLQEYISANLA